MQQTGSQTQDIQLRLDRRRAGDETARAELIQCACARLERLTRTMLRQWERVHRWEQTADVLQNAAFRLYRSLADVKPVDVVDFFRLAALHVRRELHDLAKHYYGPRGSAAHHATAHLQRRGTGDESAPVAWELSADDEDPSQLAAWAEFHAQIDLLPDEERTVFDLLWYQELSQAEAAQLLGISVRTLKRRWAAARLHLHAVLAHHLPESVAAPWPQSDPADIPAPAAAHPTP